MASDNRRVRERVVSFYGVWCYITYSFPVSLYAVSLHLCVVSVGEGSLED